MEKDEKLRRWKSTFPRVNWSLPGYFHKKKYIKKPGEDRKVARWERREAKRALHLAPTFAWSIILLSCKKC